MDKRGSVKGLRVSSRSLPLGTLLFRGDRWNVLPARARRALSETIARGGAYPPLIVRPHPKRPGRFEVLDGHNRAEILRDLGRASVRCEIWPVSEEQADVLAVSLNALRGRPDHLRRARAVRRLMRRIGPERAAQAVGTTAAGLEQCVRPLDRPTMAPEARGLDLRALVFHLPPQQAAEVERALARAGGGRNTRGQALVGLVRRPSDAIPQAEVGKGNRARQNTGAVSTEEQTNQES